MNVNSAHPTPHPHPNQPQQKRWNILSGSPRASKNIHLYLTKEKQLKKSPNKKQVHLSMDWFKGKLKPETPIFHGKNPWVSGVDFPLNQSIAIDFGLIFSPFLTPQKRGRHATCYWRLLGPSPSLQARHQAPKLGARSGLAAVVRRGHQKALVGAQEASVGKAPVSHRGGENTEKHGKIWENMGKLMKNHVEDGGERYEKRWGKCGRTM